MYTEVLPTNSILPYSILSWKYVAFYLLSFALTYVAGNLLLHSEYFCPCLAEERIEQSRYLYKSLREGFSKEEKQLVNWLVKNQSREYISNWAFSYIRRKKSRIRDKKMRLNFRWALRTFGALPCCYLSYHISIFWILTMYGVSCCKMGIET